jgi:hypothetical protein
VAYDWFAPDVVVKAEYYEVIERDEKLLVFTQLLTDSEERWWADELDPKEIAELKARGWKMSTKMRRRKRVHKYTMSGAEVLEDHGLIAGPNIPIVPVYGKRWFVDNQERFRGHVSKLMDAQRNYNAKVSKLAEINAWRRARSRYSSPSRCRRIFRTCGLNRSRSATPMRWSIRSSIRSRQVCRDGADRQDRAAAASARHGALLQIAAGDLQAETDDGSDEVKANTSAEAMDIAATRIDAKSAIYLDNMKQSVQREGEIYLGMAPECYFEDGRTVETMSEDGDDGEATLKESFTDSQGVHRVRNDFSSGRYKVIADVTEATATRRDKTVKSMLATAQIAMEAGDQELAQASILTAVMNQDGEGSASIQKYARKKLVVMGIEEPNEAEKAEMEQAQQQPDQTQQALAAKTAALAADAELKGAKAGEAKASTMLKVAQATAIGGPEAEPAVPDGLEAAHKVADINKKTAEAEHIRTQTAHLPEQLAIEGHNAETNRMKALADRAKKFFGGG